MDNVKVIAIVLGLVISIGIISIGIVKGCELLEKETQLNAVNKGLTYINAGWYPQSMFSK